MQLNFCIEVPKSTRRGDRTTITILQGPTLYVRWIKVELHVAQKLVVIILINKDLSSLYSTVIQMVVSTRFIFLNAVSLWHIFLQGPTP